jgi:ABC-type uncharacterized transport system auxiliary subunit
MSSDHIMLVQSDHRMSYYVGSRWPAALPELVEAMTVDTLRSSGDWKTVEDSASAFSSEYILQIVIQRFEADYSTGTSAPEIHVVLDCTVGKRAGREILASFIAEGAAHANENRVAEVVTAFEAASNKALAQMAQRASQAVRASDQKAPSPVPSNTR